MTDLVRGNDNATEAASVLDNRHTVDLLQAFVHHAGAADIRKSCAHENHNIIALLLRNTSSPG